MGIFLRVSQVAELLHVPRHQVGELLVEALGLGLVFALEQPAVVAVPLMRSHLKT